MKKSCARFRGNTRRRTKNSARNVEENGSCHYMRNSINKFQSLVIKIMKVYSQNPGVKTDIKNI